jgi:hypothetical protein
MWALGFLRWVPHPLVCKGADFLLGSSGFFFVFVGLFSLRQGTTLVVPEFDAKARGFSR